jgi:ABC-2 type transport system permease protein
MLDYPYFPDVRAEGLSSDSGITANLGQITMNWSSPILIDQAKTGGRTVTELIRSSSGAWTSSSTDMQPNFRTHGKLGFARGDDLGTKTLAVAVEGRFTSAFAGKSSPLLPAATDQKKDGATDPKTEGDAAQAKKPVISGVIETSPPSARLILIGSESFLTDTAIGLANEATQSRYLKPIDLVQNAVEWSLEDRGLLALRGRGQFSRLLEPLSREGRMAYEYLNYALALGGLALLYWLARRSRQRRDRALARYLEPTATPSLHEGRA